MKKNARLTYRNTLTGIELDCMFRVGFSSLMNNISCSKQSSLFLHSLEHRSASAGLQGHCLVCLGSVYIKKMTVVYVRPHFRVSVRAYSPHNLHHTGYIENDKQRVVGLRSVAFSLQLRSWLILRLTNTGWTVVCTFRLRSLSCFLT